jgi:hypothetical protein
MPAESLATCRQFCPVGMSSSTLETVVLVVDFMESQFREAIDPEYPTFAASL